MKAIYKIKILVTCVACFALTSLKAQQQDSTIYPIVIQFNSMGTGVPGDTALRNYIVSFRKKNKLKKITALRIGPMGREGEYWLTFSLKELNKKQAAIFSGGVRSITEKMKDRGSAVFIENMAVAKNELPLRALPVEVTF